MLEQSLSSQELNANSVIIDQLCDQSVKIEAWFRQQWQIARPPLYGSIDIRNANFKLAQVDTNLFPAGFNNLNSVNMPLYVQAMQATIAEICPQVSRLLLLPEDHTRNLFYLENVAILQTILQQAGFEVRIGTLSTEVSEPQTHHLPSGQSLLVEPVVRKDDKIGVADFFPCMVILNNDLSSGIPPILQQLKQIFMPAIELGWTIRLKSEHFRYYQEVGTAFAAALNIDPWLIMPYFDQCPEIDFKNQTGQEALIDRANALLKQIQHKYLQYNIQQQPFLVIKADQGTYGMAVMMIDDPEQLRQLNRKQRNKMSVIKGGKQVTRVIIQEGVHTFETVGPEKSVAEPVIYLIGRHVVGGFYRVHKERGPRENLNAPGMNFEPLPFQRPCHLASGHCEDKRFYAYGVIARLAQLAAAKELKNLGGTPPDMKDCDDD